MPTQTPSSWPGQLSLTWQRRGHRTVLHDAHSGPMRVLRSLYPEGAGICHTVLVHPPGGVAGGDTLAVDAAVGPWAHALVTTPGATRFLRSDGSAAVQTVEATAAAGARLEWLPLETLAYPGAMARSRLRFTLAEGAEMIGWDVLALGLPASGQPFDRGSVVQSIELPGVWLERGRTNGDDLRLLDSPLGWAGRRVLATVWFAAGAPLAPARRDGLIAAARTGIAVDAALASHAGVTSTDARVIVLRALAPNVETAMRLSLAVWRAWRTMAWGTGGDTPRLWRM